MVRMRRRRRLDPTPWWRLGLRALGLGLLCAGALPLGAQEIRWPELGSSVRITTVADPPQEFFDAAAQIGLAPTSSLLRKSQDGRVRLLGSFVGGTDRSFGVYRGALDRVASFQLDYVSALDEQIGTRSHGKQGLAIGAGVGAIAGVALAAAISDNAAGSDYMIGAAFLAAPFSLLGGLVGLVIRSYIWEPVQLPG